MGMTNDSQEMPSWMERKMHCPHLANSLLLYKSTSQNCKLPETGEGCYLLTLKNRKQTKCSLKRLLKYYGLKQLKQNDPLNKYLFSIYYVPAYCWEMRNNSKSKRTMLIVINMV